MTEGLTEVYRVYTDLDFCRPDKCTLLDSVAFAFCRCLQVASTLLCLLHKSSGVRCR